MADDRLAWVGRFWEKVDRRGPDECWPWLGYVDAFGHGRCRWADGKSERCHRASYEMAKGTIPFGLLVRHTCDNASCVNPGHLVLGTIQDNNRDRQERERYRPVLPKQPSVAVRRYQGGTKAPPIEEKLLSSIIKDPRTGCWNWKKDKSAFGRARVKIGKRKFSASRVAYETWVGQIPEGMLVLHSCDNGACINPAHLRVGTHAENMADMVVRGRAATGDRNGARINPTRGALCGLAKLTNDAVREIRAGMPTKEAMAKFGVSKAAVCKARNGDTWFVVPGKAKHKPLPGKTKLTLAQAKIIHRSRVPADVLAERFGISQVTVYRIRRLPTWNGKPL